MGLIWTKILIALRGSTDEADDVIMPRQALRLLDQEIREAEEQVSIGRSSLANLMAKNILAAREVEQTIGRLAELSGNVEKALALGHNDLALDVAAHIGRFELILAEDQRVSQLYAGSVETLRTSLDSGEGTLRLLKQQIDVLRTRRPSATHCDTNVRLQAAADSLDGIRQRQQEVAEHLEARNALCTRDPRLEKRLREALVIPDESNAHAVLARIKATPQQTVPSR
ncbi:PspA/IM30 family protein [Pseudomonas sp. 3A(2025)]